MKRMLKSTLLCSFIGFMIALMRFFPHPLFLGAGIGAMIGFVIMGFIKIAEGYD